jgi:hypothetical protein
VICPSHLVGRYERVRTAPIAKYSISGQVTPDGLGVHKNWPRQPSDRDVANWNTLCMSERILRVAETGDHGDVLHRMSVETPPVTPRAEKQTGDDIDRPEWPPLGNFNEAIRWVLECQPHASSGATGKVRSSRNRPSFEFDMTAAWILALRSESQYRRSEAQFYEKVRSSQDGFAMFCGRTEPANICAHLR